MVAAAAQLPPAPAPPASPGAEAAAAVARAESLLKEDRYEDALDAAGSAVERWPDHAPAHVVMAGALYRRGDFVEAERHYRRSVELDPNDAAGHYGVGRILRTLGRYGEAAESFSKAAALAPEVPKHLRTLANHLARREDSLQMLRRYLELARPNPGAVGEDEAMVRNVEAHIALLEMLGDRPLSLIERKQPGVMRLQVVRGQAYMKLTVMGLENQRFVFDTGATGVTISPRLAARAKLKPIKPFTIAGTGAKRTETGDLVLLEEIAVGDGILIRNVPATVREPAGPEEGLVGPSLFHAFDITVDLKQRRLSFETPPGETPSGPRPGAVETFRNVGGEIVITAKVNGVPLNSMVDTGSASTIVGKATVARVPGLQALPGQWFAGTTVGVGGALADRKVILDGTLQFGGHDYPADGLLSGDLSGFSRALESEVYVILGAPHLDEVPFTIDYRAMTVTFAPHRKGQG